MVSEFHNYTLVPCQTHQCIYADVPKSITLIILRISCHGYLAICRFSMIAPQIKNLNFRNFFLKQLDLAVMKLTANSLVNFRSSKHDSTGKASAFAVLIAMSLLRRGCYSHYRLRNM